MSVRARTASPRRLTVLKVGGSLFERDAGAILDAVAGAWEAGGEILLVHGGGRELSRWLRRLGIESRFIDGQRVTTPDALPVALMVLGGLVNRRTVEDLLRRGCPAVGLTGADGGGTLAAPLDGASLGAVGRIVSVNAPFYLRLIAERRLPVLASLGWCPERGWLNVNADLLAGALAAGLGARRLLLMTDVPGVRGSDGSTLDTVTLAQMRDLVDDGVARDGMIPKLEACRIALAARVPEVRVLGPDAVGLARILAAPRGRRSARGLGGSRGPIRDAAGGTRVLRVALPQSGLRGGPRTRVEA